MTVLKGVGVLLRIVSALCLVALAIFGLFRLPAIEAFLRSQKQVLPQVYILHEPNTPIKRGLILFVHGLQGNYLTTWQNANGQGWYDLFKADKELQDFDIAAFGYGTHILIDKTRIEDAVSFLRRRLDGPYANYDHLVIVGHSMGGLITREALNQSGFGSRQGQIVTFITAGTPFDGSELADALGYLTTYASQQIDVLSTSAAFRSASERSWDALRKQCGDRLYHLAAFEKNPLVIGNQPGVFIVTGHSATLGCDEQLGCDDDHINICKLPDAAAPLYKAARKLILKREQELITFPQVPLGTKVVGPKSFLLGPGEVKVDKDIRIPASARLEIAAGTTLWFHGGATLECEGKLIAGANFSDEDVQRVVFDFSKNEQQRLGNVCLRGPGTHASEFWHCDILGGRGLALKKPNPKVRLETNWYRDVRREPTAKPCGGGLALVGTSEVRLIDCRFANCQAFTGGAIALIGASRTDLSQCRFQGNTSGFGGGAIFCQASEAYIRKCSFSRNDTGIRYAMGSENGVRDMRQYACGGALYLGYQSFAELRGCTFLRNQAEYVGGAIYLLDSAPFKYENAQATICADCRFVGNLALGTFTTNNGGGGAIYVDGESSLAITNGTFQSNRFDPDSSRSGQAVLDASASRASGIKWNGNVVAFNSWHVPVDDKLESIERRAFGAADPRTLSVAPIYDALMENPRCYRAVGPDKRKIDTVVIHHISAIGWGNEDFLEQYAEQIQAFEKDHAVADAERKYDWRFCRKVLELYGVSAHYLIDRKGTIYQLVRDNDVAFHAGVSKMPAPDNRESVNDFSIGIELVSSHPDDDPAVRNDRNQAYTEDQYIALNRLLIDLALRHGIASANLVGHETIAPGRKKDPGPFFNWPRVRSDLDQALRELTAE